MPRGLHICSALVIALAGCRGGSPIQPADAGPDAGDGRVTSCPTGLGPHGPACVPVLDACKDDEVARLGGGCTRVGVEECVAPGGGPGIRGPTDGSCTAVGPPTTCLAGWARVKEGWCEPILPATSCGPGTIEVIGKTDCQPVDDCGTTRWGKIAVGAGTVFVDGGYRRGDGDGSEARPFATIGAAVKAAAAGALVAVAAGTYAETVTVDKPLRLEGRCAQQVKIVGSVIALLVSATGAEVRGITVSASGDGVVLLFGGQLLLQRVVVEKCVGSGIRVLAGSRLLLQDSLIDRAGSAMLEGLIGVDAAVTLERTVVRDTPPAGSVNANGTAVVVDRAAGGASLTMRDSLVLRSRDRGVRGSGTKLTLERCAVIDTFAQGTAQDLGPGVRLGRVSGAMRAELRDCLLAGNRRAGLQLQGAEALVERCVIRDSLPATAGGMKGSGPGVVAFADPEAATLTLRESVLTRNVRNGLRLTDTVAIVERSLVSETHSDSTGVAHAIAAGYWIKGLTTELTVRESLLASNEGAGISLGSARAMVERSIIRDTIPDHVTSSGGFGLVSSATLGKAGELGPPGVLVLRDCRIAGSRVFGLYLDSTSATVERSVVRDTRAGRIEGLDPLGGYGVTASMSPLVIRDSIVAHNQSVGLFQICSELTLEGTRVRDTRPNGAEPSSPGVYVSSIAEDLGGAVFRCPDRTTATLRASVIEDSTGSGLAVLGAAASVERSAVRRTTAAIAGAQSLYGDGILVGGVIEGQALGSTSLSVVDSQVETSARAGLIYYAAGGQARRSLFRTGVFAIALEAAATAEVGDDNVYEGNAENRVTWGNQLAPSPPPAIPPPPPPP